jgi:hypothetical protein
VFNGKYAKPPLSRQCIGTSWSTAFPYKNFSAGAGLVTAKPSRFEFDENGVIAKMTIVYDTHPIRGTVGDKYA